MPSYGWSQSAPVLEVTMILKVMKYRESTDADSNKHIGYGAV